jgi:hypothetical protein
MGKLRRLRGGVGEEWRREDEWSSASGERAARRQRGRGEKGREKVGVPGVGVPHGAGVPWGLAPIGGRRPAAARARRSQAMCTTRALPAKTERGETSDRWAAAQCRAAVPLIGRAGLSAGPGRARTWVRGYADARGPA